MQTKDFEFDQKDLDITIKDILEIAPDESKGMEDFSAVIEKVISECMPSIHAKGGYTIVEETACDDSYITLGNLVFGTGRIISRQFRQAAKTAVFACTAGPEIREMYDKYMGKNEPLKAFMADTLGTVIAEKSMDMIQSSLESEMIKSGLHCTNRYSPGYCGWNVAEQQKLWTFLPANYCGISLTESSLMIPVKSVSGIIGIGENVRKNAYSCAICDLSHCIYRRKKSH